MTENGPAAITRLGDPPEKTFETDGAPCPGWSCASLTKRAWPAPPGVGGRLAVRGAGMFVGFLKRPELYATDAEGWFDTGDLARMDDGYVRITGRTKDVIIRGGENIPVVEIESVLYQHFAIGEVAIVPMPDARMNERACAFVVLRPGMSLTLAGLTAHLADRKCARNYMPERLEIVDAMPRTASGKIQKFRLRELAKDLTALHAEQSFAGQPRPSSARTGAGAPGAGPASGSAPASCASRSSTIEMRRLLGSDGSSGTSGSLSALPVT